MAMSPSPLPSTDSGYRMKRVNIESPLRGHVPRWMPRVLAPFVERVNRFRNHDYALRCCRDSLARDEAPYASHVFFDQPGLLDDADAAQRALGMACGREWSRQATLHAFYLDRGWSSGMLAAHEQCMRMGWSMELRYLSHATRAANAPGNDSGARHVEA